LVVDKARFDDSGNEGRGFVQIQNGFHNLSQHFLRLEVVFVRIRDLPHHTVESLQVSNKTILQVNAACSVTSHLQLYTGPPSKLCHDSQQHGHQPVHKLRAQELRLDSSGEVRHHRNGLIGEHQRSSLFSRSYPARTASGRDLLVEVRPTPPHRPFPVPSRESPQVSAALQRANGCCG
jgi:hypothetical protein